MLLMLQTKPRRSTPDDQAVRTERCGRSSSAASTTGAKIAHARMAGAQIEDVSTLFPGFCPLVVTQLEPGPVCGDLECVRSALAAVSRYRIARQLHLCGTIGHGWLVIGFVRRGGQAVGSGEVVCGAPRHSLDWLLLPGDEFFLVGLTQSVLRRAVPELLTVVHQKERWHADLETTEDTVGTLSGLLGRAGSGLVDALCFEELTLTAFVEARSRVCQGGFGESHAMSLVDRACRTAGEMRRGFRVSELCLALRVSPRSLLAAFTTVTGMGPHAYFMRQRLSAARHLLASARPRRETVTEAALSAGFTELGRFAGRYRAFFGENPSQTLLMARGKAAGRVRSRSSSETSCL